MLSSKKINTIVNVVIATPDDSCCDFAIKRYRRFFGLADLGAWSPLADVELAAA
jgi:hypothetical protein